MYADEEEARRQGHHLKLSHLWQNLHTTPQLHIYHWRLFFFLIHQME